MHEAEVTNYSRCLNIYANGFYCLYHEWYGKATYCDVMRHRHTRRRLADLRQTAERQQVQRDVESEGLQDPEAELDQEEDGDYSEDAEEDIDTVGVGDVVVGLDSDSDELEYAPL